MPVHIMRRELDALAREGGDVARVVDDIGVVEANIEPAEVILQHVSNAPTAACLKGRPAGRRPNEAFCRAAPR